MPGMFLLKILKAVAAEMMAVCRISPGSHVGVMRSMNVNSRSVPGYAMQLIHETNYRLNVLDHMTGVYFSEASRSKWIGVSVQIVNNIDPLYRMAVHSYGPCNFIVPTAQI
jgi:hypothetical protein